MSSIIKGEKWNVAKKIIPVLIGTFIIIGFIYKIGISDIIKTVSGVNLTLLLLSLLILCCAMILKSYRWHILLRPLCIENIRLTSYSYFVGQMTNELLPTGSGELARIAILKSNINVGFMSLISGVVLERFFDITLLLVLSIALATVLINPAIIVILLIVISMCILVLIKPDILQVISHGISRASSNYGMLAKASGIMTAKLIEFSDSLKFYSSNKKMLTFCLTLTVVSWIAFESLSQYILLLGFDIHISFVNMLGIVAVSWVLGTVSMLPGGLGAREVVYALALSGLGTPFVMGLSIAMLYRAMVYLLFALLTAISYFLNKQSRPDRVAQ